MIKAYLDSNVFIFGLKDKTNSSQVLELALDGKIEVVISDYLIEEVRENIIRRFDKEIYSKLLKTITKIPFKVNIYKAEITNTILEVGNIVNKDDAPHICAYIQDKADYFVTANRKLAQEKIAHKVNFVTPKKFVELIGLQSFDTKNEE